MLLRMQHQTSAVDPQLELPGSFAHPLGTTNKLAQRPESETTTEESDWRPVPLVRSGLATLSNSKTFGWMAAAAAEDRGFFTASAKAFVSDGLLYNCSTHRRHFPTFQPILDFVHASEHVHNAAKAAGQDTELGRHWAELCWHGASPRRSIPNRRRGESNWSTVRTRRRTGISVVHTRSRTQLLEE